jgi:uncharacterized protein (DUF736 family)
MTRRPLRALLLAALATLTLTPAAFAGDAILVRTGQADAALGVEDLSVRGVVVAAWEEEMDSGAKGGFATSEQAGSGFFEWMAVTGYERLRVDACPAPLFRVAAGTQVVGDDRRMFLVADTTQRTIEEAGTDYLRVDVTCVDANLVVLAVLVRKNGATRLIIWTFKPDLTDGAEFGFDLGRATPTSAPAIVASDGWVHVAWVDGSKLKLKRFTVGAAPGFKLTAKLTTVIETRPGQGWPQLGVDGKRVILAWERSGSVVARVSTDRGASFGSRKVILKGDPQSAKVALLGSADARGKVLVVAGTIASEGISLRSRALASVNGGRTWVRASGPDFTQGEMRAALGGPRVNPILFVAWDERLSGVETQVIRAGFGALP